MASKKPLDVWLNDRGFYRKHVAVDETCLFRAISDQVHKTQVYHEKVRTDCIKFAIENQDLFKHLVDDWSDYLDKLERHYVSCGNIEIQIISKMIRYDFKIIDASNYTVENVTKNDYDNTITLCKLSDNHYDSILPKEFIENSGFCQSIVYKVLYENVLDYNDVDNAVEIMLYKKDDDQSNSTLTSKERVILNNPPFPFKVAKALDPNQYRNIEFDAWSQSRRDFKLKDWYLGGNDFKVGTKCIFLQDKNTLECYIQALNHEGRNDTCVIYVLEWAKKIVTQRNKLFPLPNAEPWPLPYSYVRNKKNSSNISEISSEINGDFRKSLILPSSNKSLLESDDNNNNQVAYLEGSSFNYANKDETICEENLNYFGNETINDFTSGSDEDLFRDDDSVSNINNYDVWNPYGMLSCDAQMILPPPDSLLQNDAFTQFPGVQQESCFKIISHFSAIVKHSDHCCDYTSSLNSCCPNPIQITSALESSQMPVSIPIQTSAPMQSNSLPIGPILVPVTVPVPTSMTVPTPIAVPSPVPSAILPLVHVIGPLPPMPVPICYCCCNIPKVVFYLPPNFVPALPMCPIMMPQSVNPVPYQMEMESTLVPVPRVGINQFNNGQY